jgi:molybdopterin-containing oxidoreductase family membrane subunit
MSDTGLRGTGSNEPIVANPERHTLESLTAHVSDIVIKRKMQWIWKTGFIITLLGTIYFLFTIGVILFVGVGVYGINIPVAWGYPIINFVWWVGFGHAGTFISAFLYLLHQEWRASINRYAEAMTLFAIMMAGLMPLMHLGRPWFVYWLFPYPKTMNLYPQWRSALVWDVFAVGTYFTISLLFWYLGAVPDFASVRDRAVTRWKQVVYGVLALGWRGSAVHWKRYKKGYLLLAGLATPLVISVHSVVSLDFAILDLPGWHSTIYPPYFVAGALFQGFAMVLTLGIPLRKYLELEDFITLKHIENLAKMMLVTGLVTDYGYVMENFMAWYGADEFEMHTARQWWLGTYAPVYWATIFVNAVVIQLVWSKRVRTNPFVLFFIALLVDLSMWTERFTIVIITLYQDYMPSIWHKFTPTFWDWSFLLGSICCFVFLFLLFTKFVPVVAGHELRELLHKQRLEKRKQAAEAGA